MINQLTRLNTSLEEEAEDNYIAGLWHHDKTGRRCGRIIGYGFNGDDESRIVCICRVSTNVSFHTPPQITRMNRCKVA